MLGRFMQSSLPEFSSNDYQHSHVIPVHVHAKWRKQNFMIFEAFLTVQEIAH